MNDQLPCPVEDCTIPFETDLFDHLPQVHGQRGVTILAELARWAVADGDATFDAGVKTAVRLIANLRACDCFPNPNDHADRCPIYQAAAPTGEEW